MKKLDPIKRYDMLQMYYEKAGRLIRKQNPSEEDFNQFRDLTSQVLSWNDPILSEKYAEFISYLTPKEYRQYMNLEDLEDLVLKSNDQEVIYKYATEVKGANTNKILKHLHNTLCRKIEKELTPIDEL